MNNGKIWIMTLIIGLLMTHTVYAQEPGVATATVYSQESYSEAFEVLELVNEERKKEGLESLTMDRDLLEAAMLRGSELGLYFGHTRPINEVCFTACDKMYGENIAAGQGSAASVMNSWMNSEGHRSNILDEDYQSIGIGAVVIDGIPYWVQCFGIDQAESVSENSYLDEAAFRDVQFDPNFEELNYGIVTDKTRLKLGETASVQFYFDNDFSNTYIEPDYLNYETSDSDVCTISNGQITAVGSGIADITVSLLKSQEVAFTDTITVNPFEDVKEDDYYYDAVLWAVQNNITVGKDETHFAPSAACTRAQVVTFLWRTMGEPEPETTVNPFVDVTEDDYYYKAVLWASENGITVGKDDTHFAPGATVTRAQIVTFLHRNEGEPKPETTENPFVDVNESDYYYNAVLWAYENEITVGKDDTHFAPKSSCTRAQVVTFLYRAYGEEE
ncbi:MAG: S-layer homology domain-containing protein [Oliverpabstia sp.]